MTKLLLPMLMLSAAAHAQMSDADFAKSMPAPGAITYTHVDQDFTSYHKAKPREAELLDLFPGYQEPNVAQTKNGKREEFLEKIQMFVGKSRTTLNLPSAQAAAKLPAVLNIANIGSLDTTIKHKVISNAELITKQVPGTPTAFAWCAAEAGVTIERPKRELSLSHIDKPWCASAKNSVCLESCYAFPDAIKGAIGFLGLVKNSDDKKDYGLGIQSELRFFLSEAEYGHGSLAEVTGLATPVVGVIEQNVFYANQIMQYSKLVSVLQQHPSDSSKTVMTSYLAIGVKARSYNQYKLMGKSIIGSTLATGLSVYKQGMFAGVQTYFGDIQTKALAKILEN